MIKTKECAEILGSQSSIMKAIFWYVMPRGPVNVQRKPVTLQRTLTITRKCWLRLYLHDIYNYVMSASVLFCKPWHQSKVNICKRQHLRWNAGKATKYPKYSETKSLKCKGNVYRVVLSPATEMLVGRE
jgi:hypothetical protein